MIICTKKMDYPLGHQCQRVQKQVTRFLDLSVLPGILTLTSENRLS